jgi:RHS repeat-associated protein
MLGESTSGAIMGNYSWTVSFDDIDRINQYNRSNGDNQSWNLDSIGNWNTTSGAYSSLSFLENRSHNSTHELTSVTGGPNFTYDLKGNLLNTEYSSLNTSYTWDIDNHLQSYDSIDFSYDAIGRRVSKGNTLFISHGQQVIEEYTQTSLTPTPIYSLARSYIHATYVDDIIAKIEHDTLPPTIHYYHVDRQFNVRGLTSSTGNILELYTYSPYGKQTIINPSNPSALLPVSSYSNNYGFTGRYLDSEVGLWYFRARYFSDELGRFISRDPKGYVDGSSLYTGYFAQLLMVDPYGLKAQGCAGVQAGFQLGGFDRSEGKAIKDKDGEVTGIKLKGLYGSASANVSGEACTTCCEKAPHLEFQGTASIEVTFGYSVASSGFRFSGSNRLGSYDVSAWWGVRSYGEVSGGIQAQITADSCGKMEVQGSGLITGQIGIEAGASGSASFTSNVWWLPSASFTATAAAGVRLGVTFEPTFSCDASECK